jgi:hypothetical protein
MYRSSLALARSQAILLYTSHVAARRVTATDAWAGTGEACVEN